MTFRKNRPVPVAWIVGFCVLIIGIEILMSGGLPRDQLEAVYWGHETVSVSTKHPVMSGWIYFGWMRVFGNSVFSGFGINLANVLVSLAIWSWLMRLIGLDPQARAIAFWSFAASLNLYLLTIKYNANSATLPFWLLGMAGLWLGARRGALGGWALAGLAASVAMLTKYHTAVWLFAALVWLLSGREERAAWKTPGPYLAFAIFAVLIGAHLWDLDRWNWPGFGYAEEILTEGTTVVGHLLNPLRYTLIQLLGASPGLAIVLWLLRRKGPPAPGSADRMQLRFLFSFGVVFPLAPALVGLVTGGTLGSIWGIGTALLTVPFLLAWRRPAGIDPELGASVARACRLVVIGFAGLLVLGQPLRPPEYPIAEVQRRLAAALTPGELAELTLVEGNSREAQGATWYLPGHPRFAMGDTLTDMPWIARDIGPGSLLLLEGAPDDYDLGGLAAKELRHFRIDLPASDNWLYPTRAYHSDWALVRVEGKS